MVIFISMKKKQNSQAITEALKQSIANTNVSLREIERKTGVKHQSIMKFIRGEQSLRLDLADRLAAYFGLKVVKKKRR